MILIYVDQITERCIYTFDFVFKNQQVEYRIINDAKFFEESKNYHKFNYSERIFDGIQQLTPSTLLFEESIRDYDIEIAQFCNEPCYKIDQTIDPFATIFYILSRMEEYTSKLSRDHHDRFHPNSSYQFQFGILNQLVCDRLTRAIINKLHKLGLIDFPYQPHPVTICPTFDIDNTFAYQWKHGYRRILATLKDFSKNNKQRIAERKAVLNGAMKDPYDTFDKIEQIAQNHPVKLFWLLGNYAQYDRNISHADPRHQRLIRNLSQKCTIGIHPSYASNSIANLLEEEIGRLKTILNTPIKHARQHFLKLTLPITYRSLVDAGIEHDYTMGYADEVGFRAGTLRSFQWFDLNSNHIT